MLDGSFQNDNEVASEFNGNDHSGEATGHEKVVDSGENRLPDVETHANRLFSLLSELKSFADQACDAVLKEAECADRIEESMETEINRLRDQIKEQQESLQARDLALAKLDEAANTRLAVLESRIQDQETQLKSRSIQLQHLVSERDFLVGRVRETELAAEQAEVRSQQRTERMEAELTDLKLQLAQREEDLAAKELALSRHEGDLRAGIQNLQFRLQETEAKLAGRDRELKQKDALIDAAANREIEIGRLIERLSSECESLSMELCDKRLMITQLPDKMRHAGGNRGWKKVLGLTQEEAF